ncbi:hypothetical protein ACHAWO_000556 [Cyclotella atomus]|uniref:Uncharacterized protein n=1 Tax=Cyclotella atomus TaxID=382360 RepID=A0ABD3P910_9STRA
MDTPFCSNGKCTGNSNSNFEFSFVGCKVYECGVWKLEQIRAQSVKSGVIGLEWGPFTSKITNLGA